MSVLITYLITLSVEKEIIVLEKRLEKVLKFAKEICGAGKSLQKRGQVWENGEKSGDSLF